MKTKMTRGIAPLVRLNCKKGIRLAEAINSPVIVVPIYDFISNSSANPNELLKKIKKGGGLHKMLNNYKGVIILSLIMKDDLIKKFKFPEQYAEIINGLYPDFYFTPDGLTYEKKDADSLREIIRLFSLTTSLIKLCPNSHPIGLVKGSNHLQIKNHKDFFKRLGIKIFAFHTGDFFRNADNSMIQKAKYYCSLIKGEDNILMLYGLGAPKRMLEFSFSDFFITGSHFVNAKRGKIFIGTKKKKFKNMSVYEAAIYNFREISRYLKELKYQTKLFTGGKNKWEGVLREPRSVIQNQKLRK